MIKEQDLERFLKGKIVFNCKTEDSARELFRVLIDKGVTWCTGIKLNENKTNWSVYEEEIKYRYKDSGLAYGTWSYDSYESVVLGEEETETELQQSEQPSYLKFNAKNFAKFLKGKACILCDSEDKAEKLFKILGELNIIWCDGDKLSEGNGWNIYRDETHYTMSDDGKIFIGMFGKTIKM